MVEKVVPGKGFPGSSAKKGKEFQFARGQGVGLPVGFHFISSRIHLYGTNGKVGRRFTSLVGFGALPRRPAQECLDSGKKLPHGKGLGNVIIGSHFETEYLIDFLALGRKHEDGDFRTGSPNLSGYFVTALLGHHEIEKEEVPFVPAKGGQGGSSIRKAFGLVTFRLQGVK